ncbi:hypothetical protein [Christensenella intestinihominis]|uniref:hypothetical protein n=1 Tax=Christensenella intestinihominis TaxID=1851429 RepID=UPI0015609935|nr:hypothetical protein [Christensenella intestinihominis]
MTCAVIGDHENISPLLGNEIGSIHLKQQLEAIFNMLYQCDYKKFMIGGSNRFDMLASQGILDLRKKHRGIQLCCLLSQYNDLQDSDYENARNRDMISSSQILLAVCNPTNLVSSTMQAVNFARDKHRDVILLHTGDMEFHIESNLIY